VLKHWPVPVMQKNTKQKYHMLEWLAGFGHLFSFKQRETGFNTVSSNSYCSEY